MTEIECAYLAGIIDGEGTITLVQDKEFRYPVITFCNNDKNIIDYVNTFCKGVVTRKNPQKENYKLNYVWKLSYRNAIEVIKQILPYMHESNKILRGQSILDNYLKLTPRNGKYSKEMKIAKHQWEKEFFLL